MSSKLFKMEPLTAHPIYEKLMNLGAGSNAGGLFSQAALNRASGELVTIMVRVLPITSSLDRCNDAFSPQFIPRGWENATTARLLSSTANHLVGVPTIERTPMCM